MYARRKAIALIRVAYQFPIPIDDKKYVLSAFSECRDLCRQQTDFAV